MNSDYKKTVLFYIITILMMVGAVIYARSTPVAYNIVNTSNLTYVSGRVHHIIDEDLNINDEGIVRGVQNIDAEVLSGTHKGDITRIKHQMPYGHTVYLKENQHVILCIDQPDESTPYYNATVFNYNRLLPIAGIIAAFFLLLTILGGRTGLRSVYGLIFTFVMIICLLIPLICSGLPALPVSIAVIILIAGVSLISMLGFTRKTFISACGVSMGIVLCAVIFAIMSTALHINGYTIDDIETLIVISQNIDLKIRDMLFAGVLIASLGAIMDIAVSMASGVCELHQINPEASAKTLFLSGLRLSRDITGTMSNTLILAFTGTFFITLLLCRIYNISFLQVANMDSIAMEIAQALAATMALALTAPVTAYIAARIYAPDNEKKAVD